MSSISVIKLGGSLIDSDKLKDWLGLIACQGRGRAVIVPGGGCFADQVRKVQQQWQFDDLHAHHMAVLAMQQMALFFQGLFPEMNLAGSPGQIKQVLEQGQVAIWFPDINTINRTSIPASWDVTSDSLSAWLAQILSAVTLVLVKSAPIPSGCSIKELIEQGIVDKAFNQYANGSNYQVRVINRTDIDSFSAWWN